VSAAADPLVSVVIATYNRADIIGYAVRSALLSRDVALEVIVIGDGCTDATAEAIAAIGDSRVRFVNLPRNWGEQSVPSNEGIALARGEFVAFLNHDDLFLPWHLSDLLAVHGQGADVTWSPYLVVSPSDEPTHERPKYALAAITPEARFEPLTFVVASATCYRKRVLEHIGGWTRASQTILSPSQDLLFKAYRAGFDIRRTERPSALVFYTGDRKEAYVKRSSSEHAWFFDLVDAGGEALFLELMRAGVHDAAARNEMPLARFVLVRWYRRVSSLALRLFGLHPHVPIMWLRYGLRRGGLVNRARQIAGLPHIDFRMREKQVGKRR
jgi:glycosyltransferase involved in cell wall biosynthesis